MSLSETFKQSTMSHSVPTTGIMTPKIMYHSFFRGTRRLTIACAFTYDRDSHVLQYASSVYHPKAGAKVDFPTKTDKKGLTQTAFGRLSVRPVVLTDFKNPKSMDDLHKFLRGELEQFKLNSVRAKKVIA
jgi:hypothetical protein